MSVTINHQTNSVEPSSGDLLIGGSGNLLMGTTSLASGFSGYAQLEVSGNNGGIIINSSNTGATDYSRLMFTKSNSSGNEGLIRYNTNDYHMAFWTAAAERMRIDSSGNVGIGTSSPNEKLHVSGNMTVGDTANAYGEIRFNNSTITGTTRIRQSNNDGLLFFHNNSEKMRLDGSGNLLVGKTTSALATAGTAIRGDNAGLINSARAGTVLELNRLTSDGSIVDFYKNGSTTVGSIGTLSGDLNIGSGDTGLDFSAGLDAIMPYNPSTNGLRDNTIDFGQSSVRFDDIYATNGTIQTSDRNEKQDIAELSDAEQRVAIAAKGLLRKFRWRDAVEAKGDEARTHFGIIAQDLQAAFAAEGLDAGDYAMFISTTWWETQTEVPAVEAVAEVTEITTDEDGNEVVTVVTEAVEAKDAYTRTDTYDTQEEAPEGATERTRLGVRYSELLAFIIGAL